MQLFLCPERSRCKVPHSLLILEVVPTLRRNSLELTSTCTLIENTDTITLTELDKPDISLRIVEAVRNHILVNYHQTKLFTITHEDVCSICRCIEGYEWTHNNGKGNRE